MTNPPLDIIRHYRPIIDKYFMKILGSFSESPQSGIAAKFAAILVIRDNLHVDELEDLHGAEEDMEPLRSVWRSIIWQVGSYPRFAARIHTVEKHVVLAECHAHVFRCCVNVLATFNKYVNKYVTNYCNKFDNVY
jgi:hypothetical protein